MGVWIETFGLEVDVFVSESHPAWVCGLKHKGCIIWCFTSSSHPAWVCGLKPARHDLERYDFTSHPAWVCGLKLPRLIRSSRTVCHTLRGCVDWNRHLDSRGDRWCSHTLRGCVDWNSAGYQIGTTLKVSHPAWVCGLKRSVCRWAGFLRGVTPCVGVWIETPSTTWRRYLHMVTPCVGVYGLKHCSLVGQVYGRIVSIRPLVYFSSSCYKVKSQTKYVRLLTLLWLEKTRTIPDAYLLSVFFCGFT